MPLEQEVDYLGDLDPTAPGPAEFKSEGDDHFRNLKKALRQSFPGATGPILALGTATGAADAYVLTPSRPLVEYRANMLVAFRITDANTTTAPTLNISSIGAKAIKAVDGGALTAGDLPANSYQFLLYNGTDFVLQAPTKGYVDRVVQALRDYTDQLSFSSDFPNQAGSADKVITTNGTSVSWQWAQNMKRLPRTANTMLLQTDRAKLVDITSGTFTQTFDTPANLGDGWYALLANVGDGDVTIPASDGRTNWIMYPGEVRLFQCDGDALRSKVLHPFSKVFTTSGIFVKPPGYRQFGGLLWGAGGSGAKYPVGMSGDSALGGGGGACSEFVFPASAVAATEVVTIGAGGPAIEATSTNGVAGGNSTFGTLLTSGGGGPGIYALNGSVRTPGGAAYNLGIATMVQYYAGGEPYANSALNVIYGAGAGGGVYQSAGQVPGNSIFGGNGGVGSPSGVASAGVVPGGGGGATSTGTSGAGARGELRIWGTA